MSRLGGTGLARVHLLDLLTVTLLHGAALHLESRRDLAAVLREVVGQQLEVLDLLPAAQLGVEGVARGGPNKTP